MLCPDKIAMSMHGMNKFAQHGIAIKMGNDVFEFMAPNEHVMNTERATAGMKNDGSHCNKADLDVYVNGDLVDCRWGYRESEQAMLYIRTTPANGNDYLLVSKDKKISMKIHGGNVGIGGGGRQRAIDVQGQLRVNAVAHPMLFQDGSVCGYKDKEAAFEEIRKYPDFDPTARQGGYFINNLHSLNCSELIDYRQYGKSRAITHKVGDQVGWSGPAAKLKWKPWPESKHKTKQKWAGYDGITSLFRKESVQAMCASCDIGTSWFDTMFKSCMDDPRNSKCPAETMSFETTTTTTPSICDANPTLQLKTPEYSNLGGQGPDASEKGLLFPKAGMINGVAVDIKMTAVGAYEPFKAAVNGLAGSLGAVNLKVGSSATFDFTLLESGTANPVSVNGMSITFLDVDEGKRGRQRATITVCDAAVSLPAETELTVTKDGSCSSVASSKKGSGKDNPTSTAGLTDVQKKKIVSFNYGAGSTFRAAMSLAPKGKAGRNFNFAFEPVVDCMSNAR